MKKNGILHRISTAVLAGAMLLSLASCGASSSQTASSAAGKVTGTGSAKGIEGDVVVEVTADADTIYSIVVTEQNETQGIGSVACEQLPDAMVAANSYNVDGIAGATVTSDALKEAVKAALENAGLDASAFAVAKAADTTVEKTAETLDCDVVVVGAGGAGLTAAAQAAENGAKVIVVEKMPIVGGNSLKATGGMNAADTQYQADLGITDSGVQEFIEDTINGGHGINDHSLVTVMAEQSSDAIDWLTSIGAPLPKVAATGGTTHKYLHEPEDGSAVGSYLVEKLNAQAEKLGVQILLNTKATEILTNDGAACGIKAESTEHDYTINAKSVIIAAGGNDHALGVNGVVVLGALGLDAAGSAVVGQDLGGLGVQQDLHAQLFGLSVQFFHQIAAHGAAVLGLMQILVGGAAGGCHLGQRGTDGGQPVDGVGALLGHHGHQAVVVDAVAAVDGVLNELLHPAVGDAQVGLILGVGCVHAAGGLQAVAAHDGHLFHHDDLGTVLGGLCGGGQTGTAGTHHHDVTVQRLGGLFHGGVRSLGHGKGGSVQSGVLQSGLHGLLEGVAGHGGTGNAVHVVAVGSHHGIRQLFAGHRADALGLVLLGDNDGINCVGVGGHFHDDVAFNAFGRTGAGDFPGGGTGGLAAGSAAGRQRQQHGTGQHSGADAVQDPVFLHGFPPQRSSCWVGRSICDGFHKRDYNTTFTIPEIHFSHKKNSLRAWFVVHWNRQIHAAGRNPHGLQRSGIFCGHCPVRQHHPRGSAALRQPAHPFQVSAKTGRGHRPCAVPAGGAAAGADLCGPAVSGPRRAAAQPEAGDGRGADRPAPGRHRCAACGHAAVPVQLFAAGGASCVPRAVPAGAVPH